jgi:hypothetical protein
VFPVRYELNFYINLLRNSVFKGLNGDTQNQSVENPTVSYVLVVNELRQTGRI